ncbi:uncharacterized protein K444DRAFT_6072 [Hyaloscypha bicolor E]|uniref:Uncharacterized protein n=1 Tax=Hyaloscypha bicolor E TaxID=1095630 RepID=A0A2J6TVR0_9HELO|nr:uncharacterized protein K444DRAFT_6072 [Hyaloscypha bicolor E]PMD67106.1 hypothetical protein K444DRAFT_6072 [Hyaloscypha bicolor E]
MLPVLLRVGKRDQERMGISGLLFVGSFAASSSVPLRIEVLGEHCFFLVEGFPGQPATLVNRPHQNIDFFGHNRSIFFI